MKKHQKSGAYPYIEEMSEPEQIDLFDSVYSNTPPLSKDEIDLLLSASINSRVKREANMWKSLSNAIFTFNLYPSDDMASKYLLKANIAKTDVEGISRDWNNISSDVRLAFLKQAKAVS